MTKPKLSTAQTAYLFALMNTTPLKGVGGIVVEKFVLAPEPAIVADFPHLHYVLLATAKGSSYTKASIKLRDHAEKFSEVSTYWRRVYKDLLAQPQTLKDHRPITTKKAAKNTKAKP